MAVSAHIIKCSSWFSFLIKILTSLNDLLSQTKVNQLKHSLKLFIFCFSDEHKVSWLDVTVDIASLMDGFKSHYHLYSQLLS